MLAGCLNDVANSHSLPQLSVSVGYNDCTTDVRQCVDGTVVPVNVDVIAKYVKSAAPAKRQEQFARLIDGFGKDRYTIPSKFVMKPPQPDSNVVTFNFKVCLWTFVCRSRTFIGRE